MSGMREMTPQQFARWLRAFPGKLHTEAAKADARALRKALTIARRFSSGKRPNKPLRLLDNPNHKGFVGPPSVDPAVINRITGRFYSSWQIQYPATSLTRGVIISKLLNDAPYALLLQGGVFGRRKRPFALRIVAEVTPFRLKAAQDALHRALVGH